MSPVELCLGTVSAVVGAELREAMGFCWLGTTPQPGWAGRAPAHFLCELPHQVLSVQGPDWLPHPVCGAHDHQCSPGAFFMNCGIGYDWSCLCLHLCGIVVALPALSEVSSIAKPPPTSKSISVYLYNAYWKKEIGKSSSEVSRTSLYHFDLFFFSWSGKKISECSAIWVILCIVTLPLATKLFLFKAYQKHPCRSCLRVDLVELFPSFHSTLPFQDNNTVCRNGKMEQIKITLFNQL